ncbi:MAG: SDR family oxidoreductase [Acetobacteraceae bacterium]|nr:SDR family oxidoreductase [Acetobacteraceae bacterium]
MAPRRALVVGGRRGIGAAVVNVLATQGADIVFTYRSEPESVEMHLAALRKAHPKIRFEARALDLADRAALDGFARELEAGEPYSILVQVGGTTYDTLAAMMNQDAAEQTMQVNFWSFTRITRAVIRPMTRARDGRIIAIGSVIGQQASQGNAAYGASKAALLAFVRTLAIETARRSVTVNYVAPGFVDTEMMAPFAAHRGVTEGRIPAGRYARPDEIAAVVGFLTLPQASYVTGAVIPVDGGLTASIGVSRA